MEQSLSVGRDGGRSLWQEEGEGGCMPCLSVEEKTSDGVKQRKEQDILCVVWDWVVCALRFE